jgi:hypothetical protein
MNYDFINRLDKGYFRLVKRNFDGINIKIILDKYNIDFNDYHIIKQTDSFRLINLNDIFNYSGVICFHKSMYSLEYINLWFNFLYKELKIQPKFINIPFPPEYMLNKIKVIKQ